MHACMHACMHVYDQAIPGKDLMSVLYESWSEAGGDWTKSKIYLQCTSTEKTQKMGVREWMTRRELEQRLRSSWGRGNHNSKGRDRGTSEE